MPSILSRLKAANCRRDGLALGRDGSVGFVATRSGGDWSDAQKAAVKAALGLASAPLSPAQSEAALSATVEAWLDQAAQRFGYNNIVTAVSYQNSAVDLWHRQGAAFAAWRDAVWQAVFAIYTAAEAGTAVLPASGSALLATLPQPSIPSS